MKMHVLGLLIFGAEESWSCEVSSFLLLFGRRCPFSSMADHVTASVKLSRQKKDEYVRHVIRDLRTPAMPLIIDHRIPTMQLTIEFKTAPMPKKIIRQYNIL